MTPKKEWAPLNVLAGMALLIGLGLICVTTVVFIIPGAILIGYGLLFPLIEGTEHAWNALERFADWFRNDTF